jgi:hypothetical protein
VYSEEKMFDISTIFFNGLSWNIPNELNICSLIKNKEISIETPYSIKLSKIYDAWGFDTTTDLIVAANKKKLNQDSNTIKDPKMKIIFDNFSSHYIKKKKGDLQEKLADMISVYNKVTGSKTVQNEDVVKNLNFRNKVASPMCTGFGRERPILKKTPIKFHLIKRDVTTDEEISPSIDLVVLNTDSTTNEKNALGSIGEEYSSDTSSDDLIITELEHESVNVDHMNSSTISDTEWTLVEQEPKKCLTSELIDIKEDIRTEMIEIYRIYRGWYYILKYIQKGYIHKNIDNYLK